MDFLIEPSKQPYKLDIASSLKSKNSEAQTGLSNLIAGILDLPDSKFQFLLSQSRYNKTVDYLSLLSCGEDIRTSLSSLLA